MRPLLFVLLLVSTSALSGALKDEAVAARRTALDLAGAFTNEGFKVRDGHWTGVIAPAEHALIAVNLYAGNQYWFSAGGNEAAKKLGVQVYDETGAPVAAENYQEEARAAAGFSPTHSGQYFVAVSLLEGEPASVCLVYSYK